MNTRRSSADLQPRTRLITAALAGVFLAIGCGKSGQATDAAPVEAGAVDTPLADGGAEAGNGNADQANDRPADAISDGAAQDGIPDGGMDTPASLDQAVGCAASGASCAQSHCCSDPSDSCFTGAGGSFCQHAFPPPQQGAACNGAASSDLPGVAFRFTDATCSFTAAQVAAGISINYQLAIDADLPNLFGGPQDIGGCQLPDPQHGLIVFFVIEGGAQKFCLCDTGFCGAAKIATQAKKGVFAGAVAWDGRNWSGPSDTLNPKGPAFPSGTYTLTLRAQGTRGGAGTGEVPYLVIARRFITITP